MRILVAACIVLGSALPGLAEVSVRFTDGNPYDRFWIENRGCAPITGILDIDMSMSKGLVIMDTVRGGPGTKDPMPVEVEKGDIKIEPVTDGDNTLTVLIGRLAPGETATITLDLDDTQSWWDAPRVEVWADEISGAEAYLRLKGATAEAAFNNRGEALLVPNPPLSCDAPEDEPPEDTTPIA